MKQNRATSKIIGIALVCLMLGSMFGGLPSTDSVEASSSYDRQAAYDYAEKYWDEVCSDGYFWDTDSSYASLSLGTNIVGQAGFDCAHFVSCAIGNEPNESGGGLDVPSRVPPTYGEPGADRLGDWLLDNGVAEEKSSVDELEMGDVISYDWNGDGNWDHVAIYLGSSNVAAHTACVWEADWQLGGADSYRFIHIATAAPTAIYVPDNYPTIQSAVDAASPGDTIIVRDGTYIENVDVNKDYLTIESENGAEATIVQAANPDDSVFEVIADYVTLKGFTVRGAILVGSGILPSGIHLNHVSHCNVSDNRVSNNSNGIHLEFSSDNTLINNYASDNYNGIALGCSSSNVLINNEMSANDFNFGVRGLVFSHFIQDIDTSNRVDGKAIQYIMDRNGLIIDSSWDVGYLALINCADVTVRNLNLANNGQGILLAGSGGSSIENANLSRNGEGISLCYSSNNTLTNNSIFNNGEAIFIYHSSDNKFFLNDFIDSVDVHHIHSQESTNTWNSPEEITYTYNGKTYTSYLGNYWDDYSGSDTDGDGIGETPYNINSDDDNYPLVEPFENYEIGPPTLAGKVCIDPGHGGTDPGAVGWDGDAYPNEKDFTLDIALRLRDLLENEGIEVVMTREEDIDVDLQTRSDIANNNSSDIFVSIHINSGVVSAHGTETFYYDHLNIPNPEVGQAGYGLAYNIQKELVAEIGLTDRRTEGDFEYYGYHLYVLSHTDMPAALTEVAFISNPTEFELLSNPSFRQKAAQGIANGILRYFEESALTITTHSPVDIVVTDPDGLTISKLLNEIPGATYTETDIDGDGDLDAQIRIPDRKIGDYVITVIPKPDALPTETYTLEVSIFGTPIILADNVQISDIPSEGYIVRSTETTIMQIIPAAIDFDPDTLNLRSKGKYVTVYIELPPGYNVGHIDVSSVMLNEVVPALDKPTEVGDYDGDGIPDLMVKFDRAAVQTILTVSEQVEITITGEVAGIAFEGSDSIRVIND